MTPLYGPGDFERFLALRPEKALPSWRTEFSRDYARLIHSAAFRRLQGKTQLFPGVESEFFRNRLTHSLEVAQIARAIATKLNAGTLGEAELALDLELVELSCLAHDLGHPPFGHTGEAALDGVMLARGGFEGNAQTLRILTRMEKKLDDPDAQLDPETKDARWYGHGRGDISVGLNLCRRSLASVLKYDSEIPRQRPKGSPVAKGYYATERPLVEEIKADVGGASPPQEFKTIECQIMDLADDIAYSTYDIEDGFKSGLLMPLDLFFASREVKEKVASRCQRELEDTFTTADVTLVLQELLPHVTRQADPAASYWENLGKSYQASKDTAQRGFFRNALTSGLVDRAVRAVDVEIDAANPAFSKITMAPDVRAGVSVLKHLVYVLLIESPKMALVARRGTRIVQEIFGELTEDGGQKFLPADWRGRYEQAGSDHRHRVVCDFIAGMTDRHAVDFYSRLTSAGFKTIFSLH